MSTTASPAVGFFKEPWSAATHFLGALGGVFASIALISATWDDPTRMLVMGIYGACTVLVFSASTSYHFFDLGNAGNRWLRRVDHAAIFLMILGCYVPPMFHLLSGTWRSAMLITVSSIALAGILLKLVWIDSPKWMGLVLYLGMGWMIAVPSHIMWPQLTPAPRMYMIVGGLSYTLGAVVYALKRPNPWPGRFGFHEIWHCFVLGGAAVHFLFMWSLLELPLPPF